MKLIYPALTTASLLLTASPSFGLSSEEIARLGIDPGLIDLLVNLVACVGIASLISSTIAMRFAIEKAIGFSDFWDKLRLMLSASLGVPVAMILFMAFAGFTFVWTDLLSIAIGLNIVFIVVSVPCLALVSHD